MSSYIKSNQVHIARLCILAAFLLGLLGCDSSQQLASDISQYQQRLANVLEQDALSTQTVSLPPLSKSQSPNAVTQNSINLSDFYQIQQCPLGSLVAERNTSLGKLQLPSTRYVYEQQLLIALDDCIKQTSDADLQQKLQQWLRQKRANLPLAWAELIQNSQEVQHAFSANYGYVQTAEQHGLAQTLQALRYLLAINTPQQLNSSELEQHLQALGHLTLPANLARSFQLLAINLTATTTWLEQQYIPEGCATEEISKAKHKQRIEYLHNVFQTFFVQKIQASASQMNSDYYQLQPLLQQLLAEPALSDQFKHYLAEQYLQAFADYQQALGQHIQYWQGLFRQCHLRPGRG